MKGAAREAAPSYHLHAAKTTLSQVVQWAHVLTQLHARIASRFARPEPRRRALAYLHGRLSSMEHKNGWHLAEHARAATPYGMQRLLSQAGWDADLVRDDLRAYVLEHLDQASAILVSDESSFLLLQTSATVVSFIPVQAA